MYLNFLGQDVRYINSAGCNYFYDLPLFSLEVKERVQLYLYYPSGPSWSVLERSLPFTCIHRYSICLAKLFLFLVLSVSDILSV